MCSIQVIEMERGKKDTFSLRKGRIFTISVSESDIINEQPFVLFCCCFQKKNIDLMERHSYSCDFSVKCCVLMISESNANELFSLSSKNILSLFLKKMMTLKLKLDISKQLFVSDAPKKSFAFRMKSAYSWCEVAFHFDRHTREFMICIICTHFRLTLS